MGQGAVMSISKRQAIELLTLIPDGHASADLCSDINPELWVLWCETRGRLSDRSNVWTEYDVVRSCALMINTYLQDVMDSQ